MALAAVDSAASRDVYPYILSGKKHVFVTFWGNGTPRPTDVLSSALPATYVPNFAFRIPFTCSLETIYLRSGSCVYNNHEGGNFVKKVLKGTI